MARWEEWARSLKLSARALYLAARHPGTPWYAKLLATMVAAYAFSPIDLIPDPIPILGYLDDLILLPLGVWVTLKLIPPAVWEECLARAKAHSASDRPRSWAAAAVIVALWLLAVYVSVVWLWPLVRSAFPGSGGAVKKALPLVVVLTLMGTPVTAQSASSPILGRWDLTVDMPGPHRAAWLEVHRSGGSTLVGQFVGVSGSARPISRVDFRDGEVRFSIPRQWESGEGELAVRARLEGEALQGTVTLPDGKSFPLAGSRAPSLRRAAEPRWGEPIRLIPASGLTGWRVLGGTSEWEVADGVLRNRKSGANLASEREFTDFKLHLEFRLPPGGNSGVYLRGRYEVQILDPGEPGAEPDYGAVGGVYGFIAPSRIAGRPAGEWNSFDLTLVGRMVTVVLNGDAVIVDREIPGITGGALDSDEGAPGPLLLQGDHTAVEFRNIVVTPAT